LISGSKPKSWARSRQVGLVAAISSYFQAPALQPPLVQNRFFHAAVHFEPDQALAAVLGGEAA
jgi:hypothetical protein